MGKGTVRECGMHMDTRLYSKCRTRKDLLQTRGTLLRVMWQPGWEGALGETGHAYVEA